MSKAKNGFFNRGKQNEIFQSRLQIKGKLLCGDDFYSTFNSISNFLFDFDKDYIFSIELNSGTLISFLCEDPFFFNKVKNTFFTILENNVNGVDSLFYFDFEKNIIENKLLIFTGEMAISTEEIIKKTTDSNNFQNKNDKNINIPMNSTQNTDNIDINFDPFQSKYAKRTQPITMPPLLYNWDEIIKELGTLMLYRDRVDERQFNDIFLGVTNKNESVLKQSLYNIGPNGYKLLFDLKLSNLQKIMLS